MTTPDPWRFQWPDGTWIRWNPETEEWEKESGTPIEPPGADAQPATVPVPDTDTELPSAPAPATDEPRDDSQDDEELYDFEEPDEEDADVDDDADEDEDEGSRTRARPAEPVFAGRQLDERPGRSLMPTIVGGAAIGVAVGIVVTILTR